MLDDQSLAWRDEGMGLPMMIWCLQTSTFDGEVGAEELVDDVGESQGGGNDGHAYNSIGHAVTGVFDALFVATGCEPVEAGPEEVEENGNGGDGDGNADNRAND